ncbi:Proteasome subunit alpha type-2 [Camelus dromedarius]|uniref:Proteasome subunit alpha type-2 n=1 Tax=Camelus dromedarius TaxID=9838 RepID=A0A5N4E5K6_CAMDR|nr:Proteasome subunit alpha type-2 [Camelus dromedarius]
MEEWKLDQEEEESTPLIHFSQQLRRQRLDRITPTSLQSLSAKLIQIECVLAAVAGGDPSVGIRAANGVVFATEKKQKSTLQEPIAATLPVQSLTPVMQEYTQSGGVSHLLVVGKRDNPIYSVRYIQNLLCLKSHIMGKNYVTGRTNLEKRYNDDLELEDATQTAKLTLKERFERQMTEDYVEVGVCREARSTRLTPAKAKDYLAAITSS